MNELTWGQRFVWDILQSLAPANHYISLRFRVHVPTGATLDGVRDALHTLVRRHESLRTRFTVGADGEPRQRADPADAVPMEVHETEPGGVRRLAEQEEERLWREPFRHDTEWPLRVSVVVAGGRPRQVVFVFSHLAVDAWGCVVLRKEFLDLLRDGDAGHTQVGWQEQAGWQPRDRAAFEASVEGRNASDLSLAHWRRVLETAPQTAFPALPEAGETPLFPGVGVHSVALAAAAQALATRHRVGPAAVLLAALSTVVGIRTGTEAVPVLLATGNRFTPVDAASVGTFYQAAPALIRLDAGSLAGTIRNAHKASTVAYLRGQSDPRDVARLLASVKHRRGVDFELQTTVNVVPEPGSVRMPPAVHDVAALREMTASTLVSDLEGRDNERLKLYVHVKALRSRAVIELFCDSRYLTASGARKVLAGLELVLIEMLDSGDLTLERVADLVGIAPLGRSPGWAHVDNCWVDVEAVRALVAGLPDVVASGVFVEAPAQLVAYVVAAGPSTPEGLHTAVTGRLDGHLSMAPHRYVVCGAAPARPELHDEWLRQPVLAQGSGRAGEGG
ncbi:condensation domain-containing protein [Phytohabitans aurantiacus]|uniref:Condensation domain-containing protein n=1 Tax=Phytohabitans aurantiacus TaxID=3016789 RepID=A0ABQ5QQ83_9ACTN|nr:condensation domain-containing protein [Phytohabitans aurantiacus]GLH96803.1 hypothetical protein Pa4123_20770 [Phytohabitans aurantiacus]